MEAEMDGLEVVACTRCPVLVDHRRTILNGGGPADADILLLGEGPGEREDRRGEPFVGRSGTVLDERLNERGLTRDDVRITSCIRCRPPENRDPTKQELANCREWMESEIAQVDPDVVVTLGKVASEHVLERSVAVTKEAGAMERHEVGGKERDVLICVHPASIFYDRSQEENLDAAFDAIAKLAGVSPNDD